MESTLCQRIRFRFQKKGSARFLSHHDLMRLFERAVRRASIPVRMTSGFNPHPRISFPLSLGLGIEAENEIVEMELSEWMAADEARRRIAEQMPEGIRIVSAKAISPRAKGQITDMVYEIEATEGHEVWQERIRRVMTGREIMVERTRKERIRHINIRPFLLDILWKDDRIKVRLKITNEGTARIEEVLQALLGGAAETFCRRVVRSQLNLVDDEELRRRHME